MKKNYLISLFATLLLSFMFGACSEDDNYMGYYIDLKGASDQYEYVNENGILQIPLYVTSDAGFKSAYYKLAIKDADGNTNIGSAVEFPVSGNTVDQVVEIKAVKGLSHIVFAIIDNNDQLYKRTIYISEVKAAPVLSFKDGVSEKNTVCIGIPFNIKGNIESEYELKSVWAKTVVNGVEKDSIPAALSSDFEISIPVEAGLQSVLVSASNIYGGVDTKEFKVLNVVAEDFIDVALDGNMSELNRIFRGKTNLVKGRIASGSDIVTVKYAIKKDGILGSYADMSLTDNEGNEANFSFELVGEEGLESVTVAVENKTGISVQKEYTVSKVAYLTDVVMSTDPEDKSCFLALYEPTPVFGAEEAINVQDRIDFFVANKGNGVQPLSPHAYGAGDAYYNASLPYLKGFETLTYSYLSSRRGKLYKEEFDAVNTEDALMDLLNYRIIGPNPDGENYNILTASRRVGDTFNDSSKKDGGFILGWGNHTHPTTSPAVVDNVAFAIFWVKSVQKKANGHWVIVFDVKYSLDDERSANNKGSIAPYEPYPL